MNGLEREIDALAERTAFSGVVRIERGESLAFAKAYGITALAVMGLDPW